MFGLIAVIAGGIGLLSALFSASSPFFLVLALLGFILGLVLGIIGIRKDSDRTLAIIGLSLAVLAFVVLITIVVMSMQNVLAQRRLLVG